MIRRALFLAVLAVLAACSPSKPAAGVGMRLELRGHDLVVAETFAGKPAANAGVAPGDVLILIDGMAAGDDVSRAAARVAGAAGTEVSLGFQRGKQTLEKKLVREAL